MEARAIQIYKPINKNEVRLVYRIKNSLVSGENGRHQKSYSFNKYGEENAWNMARDAFKYINTNNKLPFDFSDPLKMKLINKRGKKGHNATSGGRNVIGIRALNNDINNNSNNGDSNNKIGLSPPPVTIDDQLDCDSSQSPIPVLHSSDFAYKYEHKPSRKKHHSADGSSNSKRNSRIRTSPSSLYILALAAAEVIEEDSLIAKKITDVEFNNSIEMAKQPQIMIPETKTEFSLGYSQPYGNLVSDQIYGFPLLFNNQINNQYTTASLLNNFGNYMVIDPSLLQYFGNNTLNVQK